MAGEFRRRELIDNIFIVTHIVDDSHEGWRADQFLKNFYRRKSRNQLQKAIDDGRVILTGRRLKAATRLQIGDELKIFTEKTTEPAVDFNFKVLFEDDDVLVIDKPGNLPVHPAGRFLFNTLLMRLRKERADWMAAGKGRDFYLIHRLDRETSGVLVMAKNQPTASSLVKQFRDRNTSKRYLAIAKGPTAEDSFTIDTDIGPADRSEIRLKMNHYPKGYGEENPMSGAAHALTHFKVIKRVAGMDLIDCDLQTGRQHQIRVHLASVGNPVIGDKLYSGNEDIFLRYIEEGVITPAMKARLGIERHALHSAYLKFRHPISNEWMEVTSTLPKDMENLLQNGFGS